MKTRQNCWEVQKCGRQTGGLQADILGVCPAAEEERLSGIHGGLNAGRACWVVAGTFCGGKIQGSFAEKFKNCRFCDFYKQVQAEESGSFKMSIVLLSRMKEVQV